MTKLIRHGYKAIPHISPDERLAFKGEIANWLHSSRIDYKLDMDTGILAELLVDQLVSIARMRAAQIHKDQKPDQ